MLLYCSLSIFLFYCISIHNLSCLPRVFRRTSFIRHPQTQRLVANDGIARCLRGIFPWPDWGHLTYNKVSPIQSLTRADLRVREVAPGTVIDVAQLTCIERIP